MIFDKNYLYFLRNREIDALYFTLALKHFADGLITVFVPIYLLNLGFSLPSVLFYYFMHAACMVLLPFLTLPILQSISNRLMMLLAIPLIVFYYMGLAFLPDSAELYYILPVVWALGGLFFNIGYDIDFTGAVDDGHVNEEVGAKHAINSLVSFSSPFVGAILIKFFGFEYNYMVAKASEGSPNPTAAL